MGSRSPGRPVSTCEFQRSETIHPEESSEENLIVGLILIVAGRMFLSAVLNMQFKISMISCELSMSILKNRC